ncbi:phage minor capsid protein [[Clostridium] colinum]|uniref:phage minor capsid protein n=1 Tax=[Clostridium] colinum TaxID=36835 RepID=UPI0020255648|nr:phage minor capsid protein [[Clostridium] colinum]
MNNLFDENFFEDLPKNIDDNMNYINNFVIEVICKRLYEIGNLQSSYDISQLKNAIEYAGLDLKVIEEKISKITNQNLEEIDKIFEETAENNINFANIYYKYRGLKELKSYKDNKKLVKLVEAIKNQTKKDYKNISKTRGFLTGGKYKNTRQQYISIIDKGITAVTTGVMDYNTAIRNAVIDMVNSGVRTVDFESGYSRRMDSQVRMNILEGMRRLNMEMLDITSKEFGADGYEITAHSLCAPDHQLIQGRQYSKKEYEELNSSLKRPIGTLNCRHIAIPIILGVSSPTYSNKELDKIIDKSNQEVIYDDKVYTRYEASQRQRVLETKIRKEKEKLQAFEILKDDIQIKKSKNKVKELTNLYKDFSKEVGLSIYPEKLRI